MWFQGVQIWVDPNDIGLLQELLPENARDDFSLWSAESSFKTSAGNRFYVVNMQGGSPSLSISWVGGLSLQEVREYQADLPEGISFGFCPFGANDAAVEDKIASSVSMAEPWDKDLPLYEEE